LWFENVYNKSLKCFHRFCHSRNQPVIQHTEISVIPETVPFKVSHMQETDRREIKFIVSRDKTGRDLTVSSPSQSQALH